MKKKVAVLCMAMALVLSACNSKEEVKVAPALAGEEEAISTEAQEETVVEETVVEEVAEDVETETETETVPETEEAEGQKYTKGICTENGWESEWLGIRYTLSDGAVMSTEEELDAIMGAGQEMLSDDFTEAQLKYAELTTVYEMMCTGADQVTNLSMTVENVMVEMDVDTFVSVFKNTLAGVSAMSMTVTDEEEDVVVAGKEFKKLHCEVDYEGMSIFQDYYLTTKDTRAISIVVTYLDEVEAEKLMSGFEAY